MDPILIQQKGPATTGSLMKKNGQKAGFFITLEGGEGAGKSSQIKWLDQNLRQAGYDVLLTREPGGTPGAEIMRHVILSGAAEQFGPEMEAVLFSAARQDHVEQVIRPALEAGKVVLCDRFIDSTRVYQGISGHVDMTFLKELEQTVCEGAWPDLTLLLDLDPKEGMKRANKRRSQDQAPDRFEKETLELQNIRRNGFLSLAKEESDRIVVIDASGKEKDVANIIWETVNARLTETKRAKQA